MKMEKEQNVPGTVLVLVSESSALGHAVDVKQLLLFCMASCFYGLQSGRVVLILLCIWIALLNYLVK